MHTGQSVPTRPKFRAFLSLSDISALQNFETYVNFDVIQFFHVNLKHQEDVDVSKMSEEKTQITENISH